MGMNDLTEDEVWQLPPHKMKFYFEHRAFMDFKFKDGQLCMITYPDPIVSWERFCELDLLLMTEAYQRTDDSEPHIEHDSDVGNWNRWGVPYLQCGLEYKMTLRCYGLPNRADTKARAEASKKLLTDWLMTHGGTEEELKGISWNGSSFSLHLRCMFPSVPPEHLPKKVIKWVKKNPQLECLVYA